MIRLTILLLLLALATPAAALTISPEVDAPYDRSAQYGGWIDENGDCISTRHEVLAQESLVPPTMSPDGCKVVAGLWYGLYTARTFTDPRDLDIDHLVPLKEAHQSGAWAWSRERRRAFANDLLNPGHLIAVEASANRRKGAKDLAEWLPPNERFHCAYVQAWVAVKRAWGLSMDQAEVTVLGRVLVERC